MKTTAKYRVIYTAHFPDGTTYAKSGDYISARSAMAKVNYLMNANENGGLTYYDIKIMKLDANQTR